MGDTFGGTHHRPQRDGRGRSQRELQDRASYDNQPQLGCGAALLLCILALAAAIGAVIA
ncbi:hypothetical protein [Streptomyces sp. ALI-76-A]|uniref:hypothetical protein n=1 Tax=Streptomyces sp. ALI-76-A TaxID=3025736 RepID=UPI00256ECF76|nr:hypothetical protein [Streptomyces sp. ALI-76-A]MDL5205114.1 hypothetical protein [Streptomyces sp. ALI-76-A]